MTKSTFLEFGITRDEDVLAMFSHILIRLTTPPVPAVLLLLAGFVALNVTALPVQQSCFGSSKYYGSFFPHNVKCKKLSNHKKESFDTLNEYAYLHELTADKNEV